MASPAETMADVHPAFAGRLAKALLSLDHEGPLPALDDTAKPYLATKGTVTLSVAISSGAGRATVVAARHQGGATPAQRASCDSFCRLIEGMPIQEVAEHGAVHLIEMLRDPAAPAPVLGILSPRNAGDIFLLAEALIRDIYRAYENDSGAARGWNQWNPKISGEWLSLSKEDQANRLKPLLLSSASKNQLAADDIWISDIERGLRVVLSFAANVPAESKPGILMGLERDLRNATGIRLEVYVEEMNDINSIRRL